MFEEFTDEQNNKKSKNMDQVTVCTAGRLKQETRIRKEETQTKKRKLD